MMSPTTATTATTAEILNLGLAAVKTRLHRARLFLRRELAAYFAEETEEEFFGPRYARAS
jgi:hypothetical protein